MGMVWAAKAGGWKSKGNGQVEKKGGEVLLLLT